MQNLNVSFGGLAMIKLVVLMMTSLDSEQSWCLDTTIASPLTEAPAIRH